MKYPSMSQFLLFQSSLIYLSPAEIQQIQVIIYQKLPMPNDSFCVNEECIRRRVSFFQFDAQSQHIANNHNVKSMHPLTFASYFSKDNKASTAMNAQQLKEQLERTRKQAFQSVVQAVRVLFYDDRLWNALEKQLPICQDLNIKTILTKLGQQDYELLQHLRLFELQQKQRNFKTYLFRYINNLQQQLHAHFNNLKKNILSTCQLLQHPHQSPPQTAPIQKKNHKAVLNHPISQKPNDMHQQMGPSSVPQQENNISVKLEYVPTNQSAFANRSKLKQEHIEYEIDDDQDEEQNQPAQRVQSGVQKGKPITKQSSQTKNQKKRRKNYILTDGIQILSQEEVIINQSRYPLKTISFLQQKLPLLKTVHIFHETMAKQAFIKKIITAFPKIKRITINSTFDFQAGIFKQIYQQIPRNMTLELKWDMQKFFTEYYAYKNFPFRSIKRIERMKPINMQQLHNLIPGNNSLWDCDSACHNWLISQRPTIFDSIETIRLNMGIMGSAYVKSLKKLKTLILSEGYLLDDGYSNLCDLIDSNRLETIVFNKCQITNQLLGKMKKLDKLSRLSITNPKLSFVNPQAFFGLINLTHLNIEGVIFQSEQKYRNYSIFRRLMNLKNLKHLSLYNCRVSYQYSFQLQYHLQTHLLESDILMQLSSNAFNSLVYLNLGRTNVNNNACQYIKKIGSLMYLNIDETQIDGDALIDAFKHMARQSFLDVPLKHLSIQANPQNRKIYFSEENLIQMAKYLKKLVYINVAFVESIYTYHFADYRALKTIALSENQFDALDMIISPEVNRYKIKERLRND